MWPRGHDRTVACLKWAAQVGVTTAASLTGLLPSPLATYGAHQEDRAKGQCGPNPQLVRLQFCPGPRHRQAQAPSPQHWLRRCPPRSLPGLCIAVRFLGLSQGPAQEVSRRIMDEC